MIDNIFTSKPNDNAISGTLITDISGHLAIFFISRNKLKTSIPQYTTIAFRNITDEKDITFERKFTNGVAEASDANSAYNQFLYRIE